MGLAGKPLLIGSLVVLAILAISVAAQEMQLIQKVEIEEEVKKLHQQFIERVGVNATPEQIAEQIRSRMMAGEVKLNITPHLVGIPAFPPIECPSFMVVKLPYKAYVAKTHGYVMKYLHAKNLTLPELCADRAKVESLVREAIEKVNLTKVCEGLEKTSEHCKEIKPLACEKIEAAIPLCLEGLRRCKLVEKRVEVGREVWKERLERVKEAMEKQKEAIEELWGESLVEIEVEIEDGRAHVEIEDEIDIKFDLNTTDRETIISEIIARTGLAREEVEKVIEFEVPKPEIPKIEGIIPKCYVEERHCEQLKENLERCEEFQEKCAPRCDVIDKLATECRVSIADKEALVARIVDFIWKRCQLINYSVYEVEIEETEEETILPAEIQPVIIVTKALTPDQEAQIRTLVERLEQVYKDETWVYRAFVRANKIEDLRELEFVLTVKLDHVMRALQKKTFKELPELPAFAPPVAKILPYLEGVKTKVEAELQPAITEAEIGVLNSSEAITEHHKEEKARGIGYAILKFLGLQAAREREDAKFLEEKAKSLNEVAKSLREVAQTEEKPEVKAMLLEKIGELQQSIDALSSRGEEKRKGAFGIWSLLGLR